jgi:Uma2 family endonuclease
MPPTTSPQTASPQTTSSQTTSEDEIPIPDISHLILEDDIPVDNFQSEKQQRCLVDPLYSSNVLSRPFLVAANVGIFNSITSEGIAPDVFLSLGVEMPADWSQRQHRSYLVWQFGKFPDVVIEIVSNRKGNELRTTDPKKTCKKESYAQMGIPYYAVFDPLRQIQEPEQMNGELLKVYGLTQGRYVELDRPFYLQAVGLGLTLWQGEFEGHSDTWLRWCAPPPSGSVPDRDGQVILTGKERADTEQARADTEQARADKLAQKLRDLGLDPDEL